MMQLIPETKYWHKLWSVRFMLLAAFCEFMPQVITMWSDVIPPEQLSWLSPLFLTLAAASRFVKQNLNNAQ
jgi:hypothetical protein